MKVQRTPVLASCSVRVVGSYRSGRSFPILPGRTQPNSNASRRHVAFVLKNYPRSLECQFQEPKIALPHFAALFEGTD
jgi:hypothetical protein